MPFVYHIYRMCLRLLFGWRVRKPGPGRDPRLSYGALVPDASGVVCGGNVKLAALDRVFPEQAGNMNLLYLVSSGINTKAEAWADVCVDKGIKLVWNQNGVAYPAWAPQTYRHLNGRMSRLLRRASFVVYQSRFCKETTDLFLGPCAGAHEIVYNAVDTQAFSPSGDKKTAGPLRLLVMGSHQQPGRIAAALQAAEHVHKHGTDVRLTIAGRLDWPGADKEVQGMLEHSPVKEFVHVQGPYLYEQAAAIYRGADILLHLKYADPCPSVVIESMACGVPVVGSRSGGLPELVGEDGGVLVPVPQDFKAMHVPDAAAVAEAVLKIAGQLPAYQAAARNRAVKHFDSAAWLKKHREIFEKVLAGS